MSSTTQGMETGAGWRCGGIVLAAGEAVRMGAAKPALPFGDGTMVSTVIDTATSADLDPIVVVTGFHEEAVTEAVGDLARTVYNPNAASGNVSSLLVGIEAAGDIDAVVVMLADMPLVSADVAERLRNGLHRSGCAVAWVEYTTGRGHPIALARRTFQAIGYLSGSKALWPFFDSLAPDETFRLKVEGAPQDVNTLADYEAIADRGDGRTE